MNDIRNITFYETIILQKVRNYWITFFPWRQRMDLSQIMAGVLDSIPYPIVFVDCQHIIQYMNRQAKYHYYQERGYKDLIGKSIFDCHSQTSKTSILERFQRFLNHGQEEFLTVNVRNERIYITPVRDENGQLLGYFERFERNFEKK